MLQFYSLEAKVFVLFLFAVSGENHKGKFGEDSHVTSMVAIVPHKSMLRPSSANGNAAGTWKIQNIIV